MQAAKVDEVEVGAFVGEVLQDLELAWVRVWVGFGLGAMLGLALEVGGLGLGLGFWSWGWLAMGLELGLGLGLGLGFGGYALGSPACRDAQLAPQAGRQSKC